MRLTVPLPAGFFSLASAFSPRFRCQVYCNRVFNSRIHGWR